MSYFEQLGAEVLYGDSIDSARATWRDEEGVVQTVNVGGGDVVSDDVDTLVTYEITVEDDLMWEHIETMVNVPKDVLSGWKQQGPGLRVVLYRHMPVMPSVVVEEPVYERACTFKVEPPYNGPPPPVFELVEVIDSDDTTPPEAEDPEPSNEKEPSTKQSRRGEDNTPQFASSKTLFTQAAVPPGTKKALPVLKGRIEFD